MTLHAEPIPTTSPRPARPGAGPMSGCPFAHGAGASGAHVDFDPLSAEYLADPYPFQTAAAEAGPAFFAPSVDMWVITRHSDIEAVFKDPATFSASVGQSPVFPVSEHAKEILHEGFPASPVMSDCDPPKHTRIRAHNMKSFSARRITKIEPMVRSIADRLIAAIEPGEVDIVSALTYPLAASVIFAFIGFPPEDTDRIKAWSGNRMIFSWGRPSPEQQDEIAQNMATYFAYCQDFVQQRLAHPVEDFTSDLVRIHHADPEQMTVDDIVNVAYGLSFAGHETTTNFISNALRQLLTHRDQWEALCADRSLMSNAIEETLRYDSSIVAWRRITTRDVTVGGVDIPAGGKVMLLLGASGRDADVFDCPEQYDIHRSDASGHLAFGKGIHYCLGASLARMEAGIALGLIADLAPEIELLPGQELAFPPNISFRGPQQLLVRWPM